jgi:5-methylcytosine-specific restriction endonuclease McrA
MTTKITQTQTFISDYNKVPRAELVAAMRSRDGDTCQHPDCGRIIDFSVTEGPSEPTIDHWIPQYFGKAEGWTQEQIWDLSNLKMMHKKCNAKKGDLIPFEDGTLHEKPKSTVRFRRQKRAGRPELCVDCDNGHNLFAGEICASCGCDAQRFPRSAKVRFDECDHEILWCWVCSITPDMRPPSIGIAMRQGDSDELGEF